MAGELTCNTLIQSGFREVATNGYFLKLWHTICYNRTYSVMPVQKGMLRVLLCEYKKIHWADWVVRTASGNGAGRSSHA